MGCNQCQNRLFCRVNPWPFPPTPHPVERVTYDRFGGLLHRGEDWRAPRRREGFLPRGPRARRLVFGLGPPCVLCVSGAMPISSPSPAGPAGKPPVPVVAAVIVDQRGRLLLARRPAHKKLGLKWEFPGGKVEPGESPDAAVARELREELGVQIEGIEPLPRFTHDYGFAVIDMIPLRCRLAPGSPAPHPHEHVGLVWAELSELDGYDLAPADLPVVAALRAEPRPSAATRAPR